MHFFILMCLEGQNLELIKQATIKSTQPTRSHICNSQEERPLGQLHYFFIKLPWTAMSATGAIQK